jgi:hypothetical protein
MRCICLIALLAALSLNSIAQFNVSPTSIFRDSLALEMDFMRNKTEKRAMAVLGTWSALNITSSLILSRNSIGVEKQFHTMNGMWNIVNGGLALSGFLKGKKATISSDAIQAMDKYQKLERTLIFNSGLDLAYIAAGFYLDERGKHETDIKRSEQFQGFGRSLILQGSFLLAFDAIFYSSLRYQSSYFKNVMQIIWLRNGSAGINIRF